MNAEKLNPCPFCGIIPMLWTDNLSYDLIEHPNTDCPCADVRLYAPKGDYSCWNTRDGEGEGK
jgi:hypothetical protein